MSAENPRSARRARLGATCLVAAPLVMLIADTARAVGGEGRFWTWSIGLWISFLFFVGAILAIVGLLSPRADRLAIGVGTAAMIGLGMGMTMQGLFRARHMLAGAGEEAAVEILLAPILLVTSIAPGLLFPLSLLVFGVALGKTRVLTWPLALCLVAGAILFPLGRFIIGEIWLNVASDALFLVALGALARVSWRQGRVAETEAPATQPHVAAGWTTAPR